MIAAITVRPTNSGNLNHKSFSAELLLLLRHDHYPSSSNSAQKRTPSLRILLLRNQLWVGFSYGVLAHSSYFLIDAFVRLLTVVWFLVMVVVLRRSLLSGTGPDGSW